MNQSKHNSFHLRFANDNSSVIMEYQELPGFNKK